MLIFKFSIALSYMLLSSLLSSIFASTHVNEILVGLIFLYFPPLLKVLASALVLALLEFVYIVFPVACVLVLRNFTSHLFSISSKSNSSSVDMFSIFQHSGSGVH